MILSRIVVFLKGMTMGCIDVVPGVSGSTVAVLLGFYERFIAALKNIDADLIRATLAPLRNKFDAPSRQHCAETWRQKDMPWFVNLILGLLSALVIASIYIPILMERYPEVMRGFFFGLVLGSAANPFLNIKPWRRHYPIIIAAFAIAFYFLLGQQLTAPYHIADITAQEAITLEKLAALTPSILTPYDIYNLPQNAHLRELFPIAHDAGRAAFGALTLTPGTEIAIPKPFYLLCLLAGFTAICAMLMPGISGSFVLLVLGYYYFALNTAKTFFAEAASGNFLPHHGLYVLCIVGGALIGLAAFSRAVSWLLSRFRDVTHAAIIGILLGCLRAVWPFQTHDPSGLPHNIAPNPALHYFWPTLIAFVLAIGIVALTLGLQARQKNKTSSNAGHS